MYFTVPSHVWAVDARTGVKLWQFDWKSQGGEAIGNRGAAVRGNTLYFETDDCYLVALDIATGKEKWHSRYRRRRASTGPTSTFGSGAAHDRQEPRHGRHLGRRLRRARLC